ncbi:putative secreted Zn-dependent protease [Beggiatoa alba B18LD]|uniref:Putative secreted Zn-dependent protease n=1 Tax=Beggiatoa alba B18LD TaxID=395493 RepID=I3CE33_9GAMM|nr:DUF922 domain-containing protein [Beggiatoa alba]EIJ41876.1 putative secreted Zn-dependent protease [Beggiatoa alba B18LD]
MNITPLFALSLLLVAQFAEARPDINTETYYYIVDGKDAKAIRKDLNEKRQGNYDAYTKWSVKWRFFWDKKPDECTINRVTTTVDVKFTLPKLAKDTIANQDAQNRWKRYYKALIDHENGHRDYGIKAANEIEEALLNMDSYETCADLEEAANALAHDIVDENIAENKQYDIDTNHGMNDGAVFP